MNDYDIRGRDIDQQYASYGSVYMNDQQEWNLAKACIVCPSPDNVGCAMFLTSRSEVAIFSEQLRDWAVLLGEAIAISMFKPPGRKRRRVYSEIDDPKIIRQAALDGLIIALFGHRYAKTLYDRRVQFGVNEFSYRKIRDFVGGCAVNHIANFRFALEWAWGYSTSYEFDRLWRALSRGEYGPSDSFSVGEEGYNWKVPRPRASEGNYLTPQLDPSHDNEYVAPALMNDRQGYDERYAARMRAESQEDKSVTRNEIPTEHDPRGAEITPHPTRSTGRRETHQPAGARIPANQRGMKS